MVSDAGLAYKGALKNKEQKIEKSAFLAFCGGGFWANRRVCFRDCGWQGNRQSERALPGKARKPAAACIFCPKGYTFLMGNKQWNQLAKTIGNVFVDLGKLAFGSLMLGSILNGGIDLLQLFVFGAAVAMLLFVVGIWLIVLSRE
jgi:hypothetical protein